MADINQMIAERAYFKFLQRGGVHGADQKDWLEAEMELNSKPIAGAKKTAAKKTTVKKAAASSKTTTRKRVSARAKN
jgi:hypothetical protein